MNTTSLQLNRLMQQLAAAQLSAQAFALQAEMVLEDLNKAMRDEPAIQAAYSASEEAGCRHPPQFRDTSVRTMGHANRFQCRMCGEIVENDTP